MKKFEVVLWQVFNGVQVKGAAEFAHAVAAYKFARSMQGRQEVEDVEIRHHHVDGQGRPTYYEIFFLY